MKVLLYKKLLIIEATVLYIIIVCNYIVHESYIHMKF